MKMDLSPDTNSGSETPEDRLWAAADQLRANPGLTPAQYTAGESLLIGFGTRPLPSDPREREGAYPHQAVFVGFILFAA